MRKTRNMKDLSTVKRTLTNAYGGIFPIMGGMKLNALKELLNETVNDTSLSISPETRRKHLLSIDKYENKNGLMQYVANTYLAGAKMPVNLK